MAVRVFLPVIASLFLLSSCFLRRNQLKYQVQLPLTSVHHPVVNNDSLRFSFTIEPQTRTLVGLFIIYKGHKKKARMLMNVAGKGISGREFTIKYKELVVISNDSTVIGRSVDPDLFKEIVSKETPKDAVTPMYATDYLLDLPDPRNRNLKVHMEFDLKRKGDFKENYTINLPLEKVKQKSFSLFNPFK